MIPDIEITPKMVRHHTGIGIPDDATDIRVSSDFGKYVPVGEPIKKLVPRDRFSDGWPTYIEIEQQHYAKECFVTWRVGGESFGAKFLR